MRVGDLVRIVGLRVGPGHLYDHPQVGIVIDIRDIDMTVEALFGMPRRVINSKYVEVINESR